MLRAGRELGELVQPFYTGEEAQKKNLTCLGSNGKLMAQAEPEIRCSEYNCLHCTVHVNLA